MHTTTETERSTITAILHTLVKPFRPLLIKPIWTYPAVPKLKPVHKAKSKCNIHEHAIEGLWICDLTSKEQYHDLKRKKRIYYFAGGGWQMPPSPQHWKLCAELAVRFPDTIMSVVSYPLAPKSPATQAIPHLLKWFTTAMIRATEAGEEITLMGDSAGGNVALSIAILGLQEAQAPKTCLRRVVLLSPAVDLSNTNPMQAQAHKVDPVLTLPFIEKTAKAWAAGMERKDPMISPVYADLNVLVQNNISVIGVTGGWDVLTPDALVFKERCEKERVKGEWLHWDKQMHCFPLAWVYGLPESKRAFEWICDQLKKGY